MTEKDMRGVVHRLHAENSEAVLELLEFDFALGELLRNLETLATASQELHVATRQIVASPGDENFEPLADAQERAGRLNAAATQILAAFRQVHNGINGWNVAEARRPSSKPSRVRNPTDGS